MESTAGPGGGPEEARRQTTALREPRLRLLRVIQSHGDQRWGRTTVEETS
jgi:hypothetical protein